MSNNKKSTGKAGFISWIAVTAFFLVFLIVLTILEHGLLNSILTTVLGGKKPIIDDSYEKVYEYDYTSKKEAVEEGNKLNIQIEQEGAVLLLNENNALPLATGAKISVFGKNSVNLVLSGTGSGAGSSKGSATIFDGLEDGGFEYNKDLRKFYESKASGNGRTSTTLKDKTTSSPDLATGETPLKDYPSDVKSTYKEYKDAAIVVISRVGGESFDLPRTQDTSNGGIEGKHYLQLDANEIDLLDEVTSRFDKVIVVLNTLTSFQCDFIDQYNNTDGDPRIDAVLWIGGPGMTGAKGLGKLLNGEISPSGKTTDIYSRDFTKDPTWQNFGDNSQVAENKGNTAFMENNKAYSKAYNMVTYEEGVYLGYRYYETRAYEEYADNPDWYEENVVFPFGYGLSYATFDQEITGITGSLDNKGSIDIKIKVTNTSQTNQKGKEVVQLYVTKPYTRNGIEKSHVELVDYAKTKMLGKGDSQEFTFTVKAYDLASYDYNDANNNGFAGYELEAGKYIFYVGRNSHVGHDGEYAYDYDEVTVTEGMNWTNDPDNTDSDLDTTVENRFTTGDYNDIEYRLDDVIVGGGTRKGMSRTNFERTFPTALDAEERALIDDKDDNGLTEKQKLESVEHNNTAIAAEAEAEGMPKTGQSGELVLHDLVLDASGNKKEGARPVDWKDERWKPLLDKINFDDMLKLVNNGAFMTAAIESVGKNITNDSDGPVGFVNFMPGAISKIFADNNTFAVEIVIGSTWNKELAYHMGRIVGENGLWGDQSGNNGLPYTGWYAPAVNLHRSPFSGRNFEYYSEDPIISGKMAVNVITGASDKGVYTDLKHFALNDQETNRAGVSTFCTEQALRELYLKPFELAVKGKDNLALVNTSENEFEAKFKATEHRGTTGIMSSFNRIGNTWTGGDYRLMTEVLRNEWGFKGLVICDYKTEPYMNSRQMLYAGNDLILTSTSDMMWNDAKADSVEDVIILRKATKNILYAVANSNSVQINIVGYKTEWWISLTIALDVIIPVGLAVWGFFAVRKFLKGRKEQEATE